VSLTVKFLQDDVKQVFDLFDENSKIFLRGGPSLVCIYRGKAGLPAIKEVLESGVMGDGKHGGDGLLERLFG
jgi:hypothetical protein